MLLIVMKRTAEQDIFRSALENCENKFDGKKRRKDIQHETHDELFVKDTQRNKLSEVKEKKKKYDSKTRGEWW